MASLGWMPAYAVLKWMRVHFITLGVLSQLVFGMIQAHFLPWRKRTWWVLSAAAWGVIGALVLWVLNALVILKSI